MRRPPLLIWQLTRRGFGSELLLMLMARLYAAANGYEFALASRFSNISWQRGWSDYFESFCEEVDHPLAYEDSVIDTMGSRKKRWLRTSAACALSFLKMRRVLFSFQVWRSIWNPQFAQQEFVVPGQKKPVDLYSALRYQMGEVWRPNASTTSAVQSRVQAAPVRRPYVGVHIRRGDKRREAEPSSAEAYARAIERCDPSIRACFVASDSYEAVKEFAAARPAWTITSFVTPNDDGHDQSVFNLLGRDTRRELVLKLLAEIEMLRSAAFFVGTLSSNIGVLLALLRGVESCYGIDGPLRIYRPY